MQLEAIACCPIPSYLGEETKTHLTTTSFQAVVESDKISLSLRFSRLNKPIPSAAPHKTSAPDTSPALLLFSGHAPTTQCLSYTEGPKRKHGI